MNLAIKYFLALIVCLLLSAFTSISETNLRQGLSYLEAGDYNNALVEFSNEIKINVPNKLRREKNIVFFKFSFILLFIR